MLLQLVDFCMIDLKHKCFVFLIVACMEDMLHNTYMSMSMEKRISSR
jgi:lipoate-protein ligase B